MNFEENDIRPKMLDEGKLEALEADLRETSFVARKIYKRAMSSLRK